jgi:hypothetical protein
MSIKDRFTSEEWAEILQAPMLAGMAVTAADPGGLWSTLKEGTAVARSLIEAKQGVTPDSIMAQIGADFETSDGRHVAREGVKEAMHGKKPAEAAEAAVARLGKAAALVAAKAPEQADAFRQWLSQTAQKVAETGTEGGFLGFGGVKVSDSEKKTLEDIKRVLG